MERETEGASRIFEGAQKTISFHIEQSRSSFFIIPFIAVEAAVLWIKFLHCLTWVSQACHCSRSFPNVTETHTSLTRPQILDAFVKIHHMPYPHRSSRLATTNAAIQPLAPTNPWSTTEHVHHIHVVGFRHCTELRTPAFFWCFVDATHSRMSKN